MVNVFIGSITRNMGWNFVRGLFMWVDLAVYWIVKVFMQAIFDIANFSLSEGLFEKFENRVYVLLGIFMVFKVTISLLTYLVDPDKISDKEQGLAKMSTRVIIVLIMLIALPTAFNLLSRIETEVIQILPKIIMGKPTYVENRDKEKDAGADSEKKTDMVDDVGKMGESITWTVFSGFFYQNSQCLRLVDDRDPEDSELAVTELNTVWNALSVINDPCPNSKSIYKYEYRPIISTIAGGFLAWVLLGICITVAIRMFKLLILRMIAPIPIISYVDPKSAKDGAFNNWVKTLITTWTELFINLGIVYLIIFLVNEIVINSAGEVFVYATKLPFFRGLYFTIFIILGLFYFAKSAPQFILDSLGIKSKGTFAKTLGMAGALIGAGGAGVASYKAARSANDPASKHKGFDRLRNVGAGLFGGVGSAVSGGQAAMNADKDQFNAAMNARNKNVATSVSRLASGSTGWGRFKEGAGQLFLGESAVDKDDRIIKANDAAFEAGKNLKSVAESKALSAKGYGDKGLRLDYSNLDGQNIRDFNYGEYTNNLEAAKNGDATARKWFTDHGFRSWDTASKYDEDLKDRQTSIYLDRAANGYTSASGKKFTGNDYDGTVNGAYLYAKDATEEAGIVDDSGVIYNVSDLTQLKATLGKAEAASRGIKTSKKYKAQSANKEANKNN